MATEEENRKENVTIRKLTERECLRLQGFNDDEIDRLYAATDENGKRMFSKSAMYKFAGNAVCVDCFVRITEQILDDMEHPDAAKNGLDYWMAME